MVDIKEIADSRERERLRVKSRTLADDYDFDQLRQINRDSDAKTINPHIEPFLDWASSLLSRIPADWETYLAATPADLTQLIVSTTKTLDRLAQVADSPLGARGAQLNNLTNSVSNAMGKTVNSLRDLLFLQMIGADRSSETKLTLERIRNAEASIVAAQSEAEESASQLAEMAEASKEATAKIAASGRARIFHKEGEQYQKAARRWLTATTLLGIVLIFLAFGFALGRILTLPEAANPSDIATYLFGKVLILVTLGAAVAFTAKQYAANRHNAVQNFHRSSALRTYRALLAASRDEAVHDAILQQAAQAIFSPSDTGYSKNAGGYDHSPMVQLFQGLTKNGSPPPAG